MRNIINIILCIFYSVVLFEMAKIFALTLCSQPLILSPLATCMPRSHIQYKLYNTIQYNIFITSPEKGYSEIIYEQIIITYVTCKL